MLATHVPGPHSEAPAGRSTWAGAGAVQRWSLLWHGPLLFASV